MAKTAIECKKLMVEEIARRLKDAGSYIVTNYKGLSSQDFNELRKDIRETAGEYLVVKNSMARRALTKESNARILDFLKGEVAIAFSKEDPTNISKKLVEFRKKNEALEICGGIAGEYVLTREDVLTLARLPSREVLLGQLANVLNAPIQGLAAALNGIICKLVYALNAVKEKKERH